MEETEVKTKYFDKKIYKESQKIKALIYVLIIFLIGFFTGYLTSNFSRKEIANNELSVHNQSETPIAK